MNIINWIDDRFVASYYHILYCWSSID